MPGHPLLHVLGFMGGVVVADDVDLLVPAHPAIDGFQELQPSNDLGLAFGSDDRFSTLARRVVLDAGAPGGEKAVSPPSNRVEPNVEVAGRRTDPQAIRQMQKNPGPFH